MEIPSKLQDEIWNYCRANKITNIDEFTVKLIQQGFTVEKFGVTPVIKEKIIEKIVEVEKIVEIEKIVEVIKPMNLELSEDVKKHIEMLEKSRNDFKAEVERMGKELSELDQKNKKDIYGE